MRSAARGSSSAMSCLTFFLHRLERRDLQCTQLLSCNNYKLWGATSNTGDSPCSVLCGRARDLNVDRAEKDRFGASVVQMLANDAPSAIALLFDVTVRCARCRGSDAMR